jgi:long-chain acyl-CoA synthetase
MSNVLTNLPQRQAEHYGEREAYSYLSDGEWKVEKWPAFNEKVNAVACALETLGLKEQEMIAIFSANCPQIVISDFAAYANRAVPVSIYSTSSADQVQYILNDSRAAIALAGNAEQFEIVCNVAKNCPNLKIVVAFDNGVDTTKAPVTAMHFDELMELGRAASQKCRDAVASRSAAATPQDIATLIYTSGTTGEPKGAVLPHSCFNAALRLHKEHLHQLSEDDTSICFLPLSHIFEKAWTYFCFSMGMRVAINPNPREIQESLRQVKPTCMCSVPRFWEKVYTGVQDRIANMPRLQRALINRALRVGYRRNLVYKRAGRKVPYLLELQYRFFDRKIFAALRHVIGMDNGRFFPTAGAPLSPNIVEFLHSCGINIVIGYGLSETTATVSCFPEHDFTIGTVGRLMPELEVKIGENDEILVKGETIMSGYFNKPVETAAAFTEDGWFRTGDAGYIDETGALVLTDRIKDLFKTSNGKYIAPQAIESRLGEDRFIEQVAVIGDRRKYVTAIIIPAFEALKEYARRKQIAFRDNVDLVRNADIRKMIEERIEGLQEGFASFEKVKKFTLLPHEFTIESGELTNTLKLRRPVINRRYAEQIEAMYMA